MNFSYLRRKVPALMLAMMAGFAVTNAGAAVTFSTFVTGSSISGLLGQNNTIGITYAGDKFVGTVYFGQNNLQLFQTDLNGQSVSKFGSPMPTGGGEPVLAASLGQAGFGVADIYASGSDGNIYKYSHNGGSPTLFANTGINGGGVRQIFFDPGSTFGGKMLVTTTSGQILSYDHNGVMTTIANIGIDTEGMDIASAKYGKFAGQLLVASEGAGRVTAISPSGVVTILKTASGTNVYVPTIETVSTVPLNLGSSGNPIEGFYVANYPSDIQKAGASQFDGSMLGSADYRGDTIFTSEFGSNSPIWDLSYAGDSLGTFNVNIIGYLPGQSEDGIFVTAQRITDINGGSVPEPGSFALVAVALGGLAMARRKRMH